MSTYFLTQCLQVVYIVFTGFPLCMYLFAGAILCSCAGIIRYLLGGVR